MGTPTTLSTTSIVFFSFLLCYIHESNGQWNGQWTPMNNTSFNFNSPEIQDSNNSSRIPTNGNNAEIDTIIDQIISHRRESKTIGEYDQFYVDGNIDEALQNGNDVQARNLIRDKLCSLGLMNCNVEEKRPLYSNVYADTRPIKKFPPNSYRPTTFMGPNPFNHYRPMNQIPYEIANNQHFASNPSSPALNNMYSQQPIHASHFYDKKPQKPILNGNYVGPSHKVDTASGFYNLPPLNIATSSPSTNIAQGAVPNTNGLQSHVHHHYHHLDNIESVTNFPFIPKPSQFDQTLKADTNLVPHLPKDSIQSATFNGGFNSPPHIEISNGLSKHFISSNKPNNQLYTNPAEYSSSQYGNIYSQNQNYFQKELHNNNGPLESSSSHSSKTDFVNDPNLYSGPNSLERQKIIPCKCVPAHQCPIHDRIGRKEDVILPIDPRNLGKDIEAISEDMKANVTNTEVEDTNLNMETETKTRTKREENILEKNSDSSSDDFADATGRNYYSNAPIQRNCNFNEVCCRSPIQIHNNQQYGRCGIRNAAGITGRIKNPVFVDGDSEFGEYPWHVAILKKDPKESIYACGGTLIDSQHVITAAHCIKSQNGYELRARLGEWDVNHDVEFFPYIERDVVLIHIHPEYYAGTLENDLAVLKLDHPVDFSKNPHVSPACLPNHLIDYTGSRCWTSGWGKDAFGENGKYQNILKEVDVPILSNSVCERQLRSTRLGYNYKLHPGFLCAGGEEGKDACKGDGGGPLVCEQNGVWNVVGVVSWGIGCGQQNVPGVYVRVSHYLNWIRQITENNK